MIASSDFPADSGIERLHFPVNDVKEMESTLRSDDFGFEVNRLINENSSDVMMKLEEWISEANYDDLVLMYFSGHGMLNRAGELFLSCRNTRYTRLWATALKYKAVMELVHDRSLQRVAVVLDCCYAGRAIVGSRGATRGAIEEQVRTALSESGHGHFFFGASGANQTAEERESDGHGRFTKQILQGLSSGDADIDGDGKISAKDLATYVKDQLRRQNASQEPIEGGGYQGELILGGNRRKQLNLIVSTIQTSLQNNRDDHFTIETFRRIEDYLREIKSVGDVAGVLLDQRYLILKRYSTKSASIEEVARAFWSTGAADFTAKQVPQAEQPVPFEVAESRSPPNSRPPPEHQNEGPKTDDSFGTTLARRLEPFTQWRLIVQRHSEERALVKKGHAEERALIKKRHAEERETQETRSAQEGRKIRQQHRAEWLEYPGADQVRRYLIMISMITIGIVGSYSANSFVPILFAILAIVLIEGVIRFQRIIIEKEQAKRVGESSKNAN